jgi:hypothetical protein
MRAPALKLLDRGEQVADRARQAIEAHDHEDVAASDLAQQPGEERPGARGAGAVLLVDDLAAGGAKFVDLRVGGLVLGRNAGVADQASGGGMAWLQLGFWRPFTISTDVTRWSFARVFCRPPRKAADALRIWRTSQTRSGLRLLPAT